VRILVTGAMGMTGSVLVPALREHGHHVLATDIDDLDVRRPSDVHAWMHRTMIDLVAHLAAETSLEVCQNVPDHAWLTNAIGTKNVALECRKTGIPMVYISSAGVFDGTQREPYTEFDTPNPINVYGATKYEGERFVRQFVPNHYIMRCGWMMSGGPGKDHKFVSHVMTQIHDGVDTIHAVSDKFGSPTYAPDFAACFETLIRSGDYGTYHTVNAGSCSRYDVARAILDILGRYDIALRPASSSFFSERFFAPRPTSEAMRNYVLDLQGKNTMRPWRDALEDYLKAWQ